MGARLQVPTALAPARGRMLRRAFGVALGAAVVAASAQVVVPVPFSPVLEKAYIPSVERVAETARALVARRQPSRP